MSFESINLYDKVNNTSKFLKQSQAHMFDFQTNNMADIFINSLETGNHKNNKSLFRKTKVCDCLNKIKFFRNKTMKRQLCLNLSNVPFTLLYGARVAQVNLEFSASHFLLKRLKPILFKRKGLYYRK